MSNSRSPQVDRALAAFEWLPHERWIPDQLFNFYDLLGGRMCKVCDEIVSAFVQEEHCEMHIAQDIERRQEVKETNAIRPTKEVDTDFVTEYLSEHPKGETVAGISTATKKNINDVYKAIRILLGQDIVKVVGEHRVPGKRGKAAKIYGNKEVA